MGVPPLLAGGVNETLSCLPAIAVAVPMVGAPGTVAPMAKPRTTCAAVWKLVLPAWSAAMVQVPAAIVVSASAATVQMVGVKDVKATVRPELAVATNVCVPLPRKGSVPGLLKVIVWPPLGAELHA